MSESPVGSTAFPVKPIGEGCDFISGYAFKSKDFVGAGNPIIKIKNIQNGRVSTEDSQYVSDELITKKLSKFKLTNGDVLIAMTGQGSVGRVGKLYISKKETPYLNQRVGKFVADEKTLNKDYLYYVISTQAYENYLFAAGSGSGQPNLSPAIIKSIEIPYPPYDMQCRIGKILKDIDNKIELNRQTNQTLEHIAQAIFKSWFVDFQPTRAKIAAKQIGQAHQDSERSAALREALLSDGRWPEAVAAAIAEGDPERAAMAAISGAVQGCTNVAGAGATLEQLITTAALFPDALVDSELGEIPEGWAITELGELLEFNPKRTLKKGVMAPYLDMKNVPTQGHLADDVYVREMASGTKFVNGDTLLARITPCLENGKTAYVDFLEEDQVAWGSTEYIVMRPKNGRPMSLGYIIARLDSFRSKAIQTMTGTSGRQRANAKALSEQEWINYPLELLNAFDRIAGSYLAKAKANGDENKILEKTRNTLSPKLLSGELSIESNQTELDKTA